MQVSASKENILKKIRKALTQTTPLPFPASDGTSTVFKPGRQELEIEFGEQFSKLLGKFVYCADIEELETQLSTIVSHNKWEKIFFREDEMRKVFSNSFFSKENMMFAPLGTLRPSYGRCTLVSRACVTDIA